MVKWAEFFPLESLGPFLGGALLWFAANYLVIGPEIIGPRLAQRYYLPACQAAVQDGRRERAEHIRTLRQRAEEQLQAAMQEAARQVQGQVQSGVGGVLGSLFSGYGREGQQFLQRYGGQMNSWMNGMTAPVLQQQMQQRYQAARAALAQQFEEQEREARRGILHPTPAGFCGCIVSEALDDRMELAAFTASLRLYTPAGIRRLKDGTALTGPGPCGSAPLV